VDDPSAIAAPDAAINKLNPNVFIFIAETP
jgi:hypothetical protein